jgi:hypothetical protein
MGVLLTSIPSVETPPVAAVDVVEVVLEESSPSRHLFTCAVISVGGNEAWQIGHSILHVFLR